MKQYLLSVHMVEGKPMPPPDVIKKMHADVGALNEKMMKSNAWVFGGGLLLPENSTVVSEKNGEILFSDGPFVEAKEHIGGFWVIKCKDLDAALDWASQATRACQGPVEVRPFQEDAED